MAGYRGCRVRGNRLSSTEVADSPRNASRLAAVVLTACLPAVAAGCPRPALEGRPCAVDADCVDVALSCVDARCTAGAGPTDAGGVLDDDAGVDDAGVGDAGVGDAGVDDAGVDDAGSVDAGIPDVPQTCAHVHALDPTAPSGPYALDLDHDGALDDRNDDGTITNAGDGIYCNMSIAGGGWILSGYLDQDVIAASGCPPPWVLEDHSDDPLGFVGCRRGGTNGGQASIFAAVWYPYTEILGVVEAVPFGTPDAFFDSPIADSTIGDPYVDGVSVTVGDNPREHVFTFVSASPDGDPAAACPCAGGPGPPAFVGEDYVCDVPSPAAIAGGTNHFDPSDPQWDGSDFVCTSPDVVNGNFFTRNVGGPRLDNPEVRIMSDEGSADEDFAITRIEIYTR